jgi:hypothetical protein
MEFCRSVGCLRFDFFQRSPLGFRHKEVHENSACGAGTNTISLGNPTGYAPDLDRIVIAPQ